MKLPVKELSRKLSCLLKKRGRKPHPDRKYTCRLHFAPTGALPGVWASVWRGEHEVRQQRWAQHYGGEAGLGASEVGS